MRSLYELCLAEADDHLADPTAAAFHLSFEASTVTADLLAIFTATAIVAPDGTSAALRPTLRWLDSTSAFVLVPKQHEDAARAALTAAHPTVRGIPLAEWRAVEAALAAGGAVAAAATAGGATGASSAARHSASGTPRHHEDTAESAARAASSCCFGTRTKAEVESSQRSVGRSAAVAPSGATMAVAVKILSRSAVTVEASKQRWKAAAVGSASSSSASLRQSSVQGETQMPCE